MLLAAAEELEEPPPSQQTSWLEASSLYLSCSLLTVEEFLRGN